MNKFFSLFEQSLEMNEKTNLHLLPDLLKIEYHTKISNSIWNLEWNADFCRKANVQSKMSTVQRTNDWKAWCDWRVFDSTGKLSYNHRNPLLNSLVVPKWKWLVKAPMQVELPLIISLMTERFPWRSLYVTQTKKAWRIREIPVKIRTVPKLSCFALQAPFVYFSV